MLPVIAEHLGLPVSSKEGWLSGLCATILENGKGNNIELHIAFPVNDKKQIPCGRIEYTDACYVYYYGFCEDILNAEKYDILLETQIENIIDKAEPDVIHCFGTEYAHTFAAANICAAKHCSEKIIVGIQGVCTAIADSYMADLPKSVADSVTFRDFIKGDSIRQQQKKYYLRGVREREVLSKVGNAAGRTDFDRKYAYENNPKINYFKLNETLRPCFYEGRWDENKCEPHTIFVSQSDYPLKGLHYLLTAAVRLEEKYPDLKIRVAGNSLVNYSTFKDKIKISAYGKYLRKLINDGKLWNKIEFTGMLSAQDMKEEYLKCGLFLCCSANENSPNSLGEAMLLGVPCVTAMVGGIPSIFESGRDGIGYGADDTRTDESTVDIRLQKTAEKIEAAVCELWGNPAKKIEMCQNARNHAEITHDRAVNYSKMLEIYAEINSKYTTNE
jgi:glycosyltransferase involved in cell wall biosynthesis